MNNNDWLDIDVLEDYLDGKLDAKAMHRIERLSLEDPFVEEALAGLKLSPKRAQSLSLLQKQLQARIALKPAESKRWQITSQRLSIAAAAAVLFVTVSLLFWMRARNNRDQLAATNGSKKVEAVIAAKETPKIELEKVIAGESTTTYARNSNKSAKPAIPTGAAATVAPNEPVPNTVNDERPLQLIENLKKTEVLNKNVSSALASKAAGVQINRKLIRGTVYGEDKLPLLGASVKLKGTAVGAITDSNGHFNLVLDRELHDTTLQIASLGYLSKEVGAKLGELLSVELKNAGNTLNEVAVTRNDETTQKAKITGSSVITHPEPVGGWNKFEEYVVNNNKLLSNKKLTGRFIALQFKVNNNGEPFDFNVQNSNLSPKQTKEEEAEAIRLLKEGPKWTPASKSENSSGVITVNIKF